MQDKFSSVDGVRLGHNPPTHSPKPINATIFGLEGAECSFEVHR